MKTLTLRIDAKSYKAFKAAAEADRRSIGNWIETAALAHLHEAAFTSDEETSEILSNSKLVRRLRAGHAQARAKRGSFVP